MKFKNAEVVGFARQGRLVSSGGAFKFIIDLQSWKLNVGEANLLSGVKFGQYGKEYNGGQGWNERTIVNGPKAILARYAPKLLPAEYVVEKGIASKELAEALSQDEKQEIAEGSLVFKVVRVK